jgi:hypothetical protein
VLERVSSARNPRRDRFICGMREDAGGSADRTS